MSQKKCFAIFIQSNKSIGASSAFWLRLFALFIVVSIPNFANAARIPEQISFQNIVENKEFSMGEGSAFFQDSEGYMWLGGGNALIRYDGYEFHQFDVIADVNNPREKQPVYIVNQLFEDSRHIIWVATMVGLRRYDPQTEKLIKQEDDERQDLKISSVSAYRVLELPSGEILVSTRAGLVVINPHTNRYEVIVPDAKKQNWINASNIFSTYLTPSGELWLGTDKGLERVDWTTKNFTQVQFNPDDPESALNLQVKNVRDIVADSDGTLWLATKNGLVHYDPTTHQGKLYANNPSDRYSLGGNDLYKLLIDSQGLLWIASDGGGVSVYDKEKNHFVNYQAELGRAGALNTNKVRTLYEDRNGDIWVGNYPVGVNFYDRSTGPITTYAANIANPKSLSLTSVLSASEDVRGNLWLGTDGGGLNYFDREKNEFTHFKSNPNDPTTLNGDSVLTTLVDSTGLVWCGTWGNGLASYNPVEKKFTRYPFSDNANLTANGGSSTILNSAIVWDIREDKHHMLWIGTHTGGVSKFDPRTKLFTAYAPIAGDPTSLNSHMVWKTYEDSQGNLWLATTQGISLMNQKDGTFSHFISNPKDPTTLSNSNVLSIFEDTKKRLWFGTSSGLNLYNEKTKTFTVYNKNDGFFDNVIRDVLQDRDGNLWVSTNNGFSSFNPDTKKIKNYSRIAGRMVGRFANNSGALSSRGEIIFGGVEGLRIFSPQELTENKKKPPVVLSDFRLFSESIVAGDEDGILTRVINHTDSITLDHTKTMFAFSFSALNFRDPEKNKYTYKLEGFDKDWLSASNQRMAKYTNLDAGNYVFKVKASNNDGVWNEEGTSIKITVLAPIWKSWPAYFLYTLTLILAIVHLALSQRKKLNDAKKKIAQERALNERMRNLDALKENFLANTSHELCTPINGIIGLAESINENYAELSTEEIEQKIKMILRSGKRLANIVNDIIEFSQLANNELVLTLTNVPLHRTVTRVLGDLQENIGTKSLVLSSNISDDVNVFSNEHRLTQILHHLVENAIKFTRKGSIRIFHYQDEKFDNISISDTGIGIAPEHIESIFTAFQQVDGSTKRASEGAGLGLSVILKLVELHRGKINVESVVGEGTTFRIMLPRAVVPATSQLQEGAGGNTQVADTQLSTTTRIPLLDEVNHKIHTVYFNSHLYADETSVPEYVGADRKAKILIVDDDAVNRMVIAAHLRKQQFETVDAVDGYEALKIISEQHDIDLIVLDVMMPQMTGYETCEKIRKVHSLHMLPVIFLTANHQVGEVIKAFSVGGSDFLTKPIAGKMLCDKVKTHLMLHEQIRKIDLCVDAIKAKNQQKSIADNAPQWDADVAKQHYISLQQVIVNIVEQAFRLISPAEMIGCWIKNANNDFECIENSPSLPAIAPHKPLTWKEMEALTDIVGKENKNISLIKNLTEAASTGRLGKNFVNAWELYCELIFRDNFIVGFIIIGGSTSSFMMPEDKDILLQCQTHIAAAFKKMERIKALNVALE